MPDPLMLSGRKPANTLQTVNHDRQGLVTIGSGDGMKSAIFCASKSTSVAH